jgi:hypothetical protein
MRINGAGIEVPPKSGFIFKNSIQNIEVLSGQAR